MLSNVWEMAGAKCTLTAWMCAYCRPLIKKTVTVRVKCVPLPVTGWGYFYPASEK